MNNCTVSDNIVPVNVNLKSWADENGESFYLFSGGISQTLFMLSVVPPHFDFYLILFLS